MRKSNGGKGNHGHKVGSTNVIRSTSVFLHPASQRLTTSVSSEYRNTTTSLTETTISLEIKPFVFPAAETASDGSSDLSLVLGLVGGLAILFCTVVMTIIWYRRRKKVGHEPKAYTENSDHGKENTVTSENEYATIQDGYDSLCFKEEKAGHVYTVCEKTAESTDIEEIKNKSDTSYIYEPIENVKERETIYSNKNSVVKPHYFILEKV